jgi:hypothetical protein
VKANELAFFGKIAASVTHELRNVLAIINESNGLMADVLGMLKETPFPQRERFQRSVQKIGEQVQRGVEIASRFNRFAHSIDDPCTDVDVNSMVTQTVSLAKRFAALQNVELKGIVSDHPIIVLTNAFRVQMALTRAIDAFIRCMSGLGGSILMLVREGVESPGLDFHFEGESCGRVIKGAVEEFDEWREFEELASILDLRYDWRTPDGGIALFFPGVQTPERTTEKV